MVFDPEFLLENDGFVRSLARAILTDESSVDDAVQQTWLAVLRAKHSEPRNFRIWLATVVRNAARDLRRRKDSRDRHEAAAARPEALGPMEAILEREAARRDVVEAVARLPEPYQTVILLKYYDQLPPRAIAAKLNIPVETARTRLKRALELLRTELAVRRGGNGNAAMALLPVAGWKFASGAATGVFTPTKLFTIMSIKTKIILATTLIILVCAAAWILKDAASTEKNIITIDSPESGSIARESQPNPNAVADAEPPAQSRRENITNKPGSRSDANLSKFGSLLVHVRFSDGTPAAEIGIAWLPVTSTRLRSPSKYYITDKEGNFSAERVPAGRVWIWLDRTWMRSAQITPNEKNEVTITIKPGIDVNGIVKLSDGSPAAGADICLWDAEQAGTTWKITNADENGNFKIKQLAISRAFAFATLKNLMPSPAKDLQGAAGTTLNITLQLSSESQAVRGKVVDVAGATVAGARVMVARPNQYRDGRIEDGLLTISGLAADTMTDEKGFFTIIPASTGPLNLYIRAEGFGLHREAISEFNRARDPIKIILQRASTLAGTVRNSAGETMKDVNLQIGVASSDPGFFHETTDAGGNYSIEAIPDEPFTIIAFTTDRGRVTSTQRGVPGEVVRWDPVIASGLTVSGRVVDENGMPQPKCTIRASAMRLEYRGEFTGGETRTDTNGKFTISNCPEEEITVTVYGPPNGAFPVKTVNRVLATAGELIITIPGGTAATSAIRGKVLDSQNQPVLTADVRIQQAGKSGGLSGYLVKSDGTFEVSQIGAGKYYLSVNAPGVGIWNSPVHAVAAGETWDLGVIRLEKTGKAIIRPRESNGALLNNIGLTRMKADNLFSESVRIDTSGNFVEELAPGKYQYLYHTWAPKFASAARVLQVEVRSGEETVVELPILPASAFEFNFSIPQSAVPPEGDSDALRFKVKNSSGVIVYESPTPWFVEKSIYKVRAAFAPGDYTFEAVTDSGLKLTGAFSAGAPGSPLVTSEYELRRE